MTLRVQHDPSDDRGMSRVLCGVEWLNSSFMTEIASGLPLAWHKCYRPPGHTGRHQCICDDSITPEQLNA